MYAYPNCNTVVYEDGLRVALHIDQIWDAADPFVVKRPDLFSSAPAHVHRTVPAKPAVEQATAAPGERRGGRGR